MAHHATFTVQLNPQETEALRKLSAQLGLTLIGGPLAGQGSPRQLLQALAASVKRHGLKHTAETLRPLFPE